jgi:hypothetical protein
VERLYKGLGQRIFKFGRCLLDISGKDLETLNLKEAELTPLPPFPCRKGGIKASPRSGERFGEGSCINFRRCLLEDRKKQSFYSHLFQPNQDLHKNCRVLCGSLFGDSCISPVNNRYLPKRFRDHNLARTLYPPSPLPYELRGVLKPLPVSGRGLERGLFFSRDV